MTMHDWENEKVMLHNLVCIQTRFVLKLGAFTPEDRSVWARVNSATGQNQGAGEGRSRLAYFGSI